MVRSTQRYRKTTGSSIGLLMIGKAWKMLRDGAFGSSRPTTMETPCDGADDVYLEIDATEGSVLGELDFHPTE